MKRCGKCAGCRRMITEGDVRIPCSLQTEPREVRRYDPDGDNARMIERLRVVIKRHGRRLELPR